MKLYLDALELVELVLGDLVLVLGDLVLVLDDLVLADLVLIHRFKTKIG